MYRSYRVEQRILPSATPDLIGEEIEEVILILRKRSTFRMYKLGNKDGTSISLAYNISPRAPLFLRLDLR